MSRGDAGAGHSGEHAGVEDLVRKVVAALAAETPTPTRTLADACARWWDDGEAVWSPNTRRLYARHRHLIERELGSVPLGELSAKHALRLLERVGDKSGQAQAGLTCNTLHAVVRYMHAVGWLSGDPLVRMRRYQTRRRVRVLSASDVSLLDAELARLTDPHWPSPGAAARVILWTGERGEAVRGLLWSEVQLHFRSLELPRGKGKRPRVRPLPPMAEEILRTLPQDGEHVFPSRRGDFAPVSDASVRRVWGDALQAVGLPACGMHVARHTVASRLMEAGASPEELRELLGHESAQTSLRYTHACGARLRKLSDKAGTK